MDSSHKKCNGCGVELPLTEFYFHKTGKEAGKPCSRCISCTRKDAVATNKASYDKNREKRLATKKRYYEANKAKLLEQNRAYHEANKAKLLEQNRAYQVSYRDQKKELLQEKHATYYAANKDVISVKNKERRASSPDRVVRSSDLNKIWKKSWALFDTYGDRLGMYDTVRRTGSGYIEVKCNYCGQWFLPTNGQVKNRLEAIDGKMSAGAEMRLYCSEGCKQVCPVYYKKTLTPGLLEFSGNREVQPELRMLVLARDNYTCQKCGVGVEESLECHHVDPVVSNPIESADVDNCITLCKQCHRQAHAIPGCTYQELKCSNY